MVARFHSRKSPIDALAASAEATWSHLHVLAINDLFRAVINDDPSPCPTDSLRHAIHLRGVLDSITTCIANMYDSQIMLTFLAQNACARHCLALQFAYGAIVIDFWWHVVNSGQFVDVVVEWLRELRVQTGINQNAQNFRTGPFAYSCEPAPELKYASQHACVHE